MFTPMQDPLVMKNPAQTSWAGGDIVNPQDADEFGSFVLEPEIAVAAQQEQLIATPVFLPVPIPMALPASVPISTPDPVFDRSARAADVAGQPTAAVLPSPQGQPDQLATVPPPAVALSLAEAIFAPNVVFGDLSPAKLGQQDTQPDVPAVENIRRTAIEAPKQLPEVDTVAVAVPATPAADVRPPIPDQIAATPFRPLPVAPIEGAPITPSQTTALDEVKSAVKPPHPLQPEGEVTFDRPKNGIAPSLSPDTVAVREPAGQPAPKAPDPIASQHDRDRLGPDRAALADPGLPVTMRLPVTRGDGPAVIVAPEPSRNGQEPAGPRRSSDRETPPLQEAKRQPITRQDRELAPMPVPGLRSPVVDPEATRAPGYASEIIEIKAKAWSDDHSVAADMITVKESTPLPLKSGSDAPGAPNPTGVERQSAPKVAPETADALVGAGDVTGPETPIPANPILENPAPETPVKDPRAKDFVKQLDLSQGSDISAPPQTTDPARLLSIPPAEESQAPNVSPLAMPAPILQPTQTLPGATAHPGLPAPARQIAEAVVAKADSTTPGRLEITLAPETLGRVHFDMQSDKNGVTITLSAERPETLDLIRRSLPDLAAELRQAGIEGGSFHFGSWNGKGQSDGRLPTSQSSPSDFDPIPVRQGQQNGPRQITGSAQLDIRL